MSKKEVSLKKSMDLKTVIGYLEDLAESMQQRVVYVQQGDEFLTLTPRPQVFVEVKAKRKKNKEKFSLSLTWYTEERDEADEEIIISAQKPVDAEEVGSDEEDSEEKSVGVELDEEPMGLTEEEEDLLEKAKEMDEMEEVADQDAKTKKDKPFML